MNNLVLTTEEISTTTRCGVELEASLAPAGQTVSNKDLNWELASSDSSEDESALIQYLSNQTSYELSIPYQYLESGIEYEIGCWFMDDDFNVSTSLTLTRIPLYPEIEVLNGAIQDAYAPYITVLRTQADCTLDQISYSWA